MIIVSVAHTPILIPSVRYPLECNFSLSSPSSFVDARRFGCLVRYIREAIITSYAVLLFEGDTDKIIVLDR